MVIIVYLLFVALVAIFGAWVATREHCNFLICPCHYWMHNRYRYWHGPIAWRWWQFIAIRIKPTVTILPTTGTSVIIYTRWGWWYVDFIFDRIS